MVPKTKRMLFGERHCSLSFALSFVWCDETHYHEKKSILFNMVCNLASQQHHYITVSRKYFTCTYTHTHTHTFLSPKMSKSGAYQDNDHHHRQPIQMMWNGGRVSSWTAPRKTKSSGISRIFCTYFEKRMRWQRHDDRANIWAL